MSFVLNLIRECCANIVRRIDSMEVQVDPEKPCPEPTSPSPEPQPKPDPDNVKEEVIKEEPKKKTTTTKHIIKDKTQKTRNKVTEEDIDNVIKHYNYGMTYKSISDATGINYSTVRQIVKENKKYLISNHPKYDNKEEVINKGPRHLDDGTIHAICKDIQEGKLSNKELIEKYQVGEHTIKRIKGGDRHTAISSMYGIVPREERNKNKDN